MPPSQDYAPQPTAETPPTFIERLEKHPYLAVATVILILLFILVIVVLQRAGVGARNGGTAWSGAGSIFFTGGRNTTPIQGQRAEDIVKQQSPDTQLGYIPIPATINTTQEDDTNMDTDFNNILAQLTQHGTSTAPTSGGTPDAYSFIPSGLIASTETTRTRSPADDELYTYGNTVGGYIQSFESMNSNAAQILKDQAEDRTNADKTEAIRRMGVAYAGLGRDLNFVDPIPAAAKTAHSAFATSYRIVGTNLTKIADAKTDKEYIDAITTYNDSVDGLTKRFLGMVNLFVMHNITFSASDPGSVFMFTNSGSASL